MGCGGKRQSNISETPSVSIVSSRQLFGTNCVHRTRPSSQTWTQTMSRYMPGTCTAGTCHRIIVEATIRYACYTSLYMHESRRLRASTSSRSYIYFRGRLTDAHVCVCVCASPFHPHAQHQSEVAAATTSPRRTNMQVHRVYAAPPPAALRSTSVETAPRNATERTSGDTNATADADEIEKRQSRRRRRRSSVMR